MYVRMHVFVWVIIVQELETLHEQEEREGEKRSALKKESRKFLRPKKNILCSQMYG